MQHELDTTISTTALLASVRELALAVLSPEGDDYDAEALAERFLALDERVSEGSIPEQWGWSGVRCTICGQSLARADHMNGCPDREHFNNQR